jgi:catalase (peroxidase I)
MVAEVYAVEGDHFVCDFVAAWEKVYESRSL